jgi:dihydrodipicolinate synthase/N-acetylneuraminate lyase
MTTAHTRRQLLAALGSAWLAPKLALRGQSGAKPLRGAFPIMATPFTESKAVDFEDLAGEVEFMVRSGVQGMVWPQSASEYTQLTKDERMKGMEVLAKAVRGKKPALVLGVQGANTEEMLEYARHAEELQPDAVIAIPPAQGKNIDDFRSYYRALCQVAKRPVFIQTSSGPKGVDPAIPFILELAREFPNFGYVKEELGLPRMVELNKSRPPIKAIFSGTGGWPYEMRLGLDGMMPGSPYSDIYAQLWVLHEAGRMDQVRELFAKLTLATTLEAQIPGMRLYVMKKRGIFKTMMSRRSEFKSTPAAIAEIDDTLAVLKPYFKV